MAELDGTLADDDEDEDDDDDEADDDGAVGVVLGVGRRVCRLKPLAELELGGGALVDADCDSWWWEVSATFVTGWWPAATAATVVTTSTQLARTAVTATTG